MSFFSLITHSENIIFFIFITVIFLALFFVRVLLPKDIYFVRHGETVLNKERIRQGSLGGLSEEGKKQVRETSLRLQKMHIEHIYVSPYERTVETAEIIHEYTHVPLSYTALLTERKNPSEIIGKKYDDLEVEKIVDQIDLSNHDPQYKFSDEENFTDLQNRAKKLLSYLAFRPHTRILCVTHRIFLTMVLAHITYGMKLTPLIHATLTYTTTVDNAGITLVRYNPWNFFLGKKTWEIVVFNDVTKV